MAVTYTYTNPSSDRAVRLYDSVTATPGNTTSSSVTSTMTFTFTKSGETTYAPAFVVSSAATAQAESS